MHFICSYWIHAFVETLLRANIMNMNLYFAFLLCVPSLMFVLNVNEKILWELKYSVSVFVQHTTAFSVDNQYCWLNTTRCKIKINLKQANIQNKLFTWKLKIPNSKIMRKKKQLDSVYSWCRRNLWRNQKCLIRRKSQMKL